MKWILWVIWYIWIAEWNERGNDVKYSVFCDLWIINHYHKWKYIPPFILSPCVVGGMESFLHWFKLQRGRMNFPFMGDYPLKWSEGTLFLPHSSTLFILNSNAVFMQPHMCNEHAKYEHHIASWDVSVSSNKLYITC